MSLCNDRLRYLKKQREIDHNEMAVRIKCRNRYIDNLYLHLYLESCDDSINDISGGSDSSIDSNDF
jgi:hypothetical protein